MYEQNYGKGKGEKETSQDLSKKEICVIYVTITNKCTTCVIDYALTLTKVMIQMMKDKPEMVMKMKTSATKTN